MKVLKYVLFALLGLIGIVLVLGLIAPREIDVNRSTVIQAPQSAVFGTVSNLRSWESWSPWKEMDPAMVVTYGDKDQGVGGSYSWTGETSGSGQLRILDTDAPNSIKTEIEFDGQGTSQGSWDFEETAEGTKTTWGIHASFPYPMNAMWLFMDFDAMVGKDFERGLALLKAKVEAEAVTVDPVSEDAGAEEKAEGTIKEKGVNE